MAHNPIRQGPVIGTDPHRTVQLPTLLNQRSKALFNALQFFFVLFVAVFA